MNVSESTNSNILISDEDVKGFNNIYIKEIIEKKNANVCPCVEYCDDDEIYILHTSGSTGKPKGVITTYKNIKYILTNMQKICPVKLNDVYLFSTPYTFDVSVTEIYSFLMGGGSVYIDKLDKMKIYRNFSNLISDNKITHIAMSPSVFDILLNFQNDEDVLLVNKYLKFAMIAGERFLPSIQEKWINKGFDFRLFNMYGPTEATVYATYYELNKDKLLTDIPIGKPLDGAFIKILDDQKIGEMVIFGEGIAKGYTDKKLTEEKFVIIDEKRGYKSGDIVSLDENGDIIYHGRNDSQIQRNGIRVEIGEIEYRIKSFSEVNDVRIFYKDNILYAFVISDYNKDDIETKMIELPRYMRPNIVIPVKEFIFNKSNKVDLKEMHKRFCEKEDGIINCSSDNTLENLIIKIASEILGGKSVRVDDDLFELGFDSLDVVTLILSIEENIDKKIEIDTIYNNRTPKKIKKAIENINVERDEESENSLDLIKLRNRIENFLKYNFEKVRFQYDPLHLQSAYVELGFKSIISLKIRLDISADEGKNLINELIDRNSVLWSRFSYSKDSFVIEEMEFKKEIIILDKNSGFITKENFDEISKELIYNSRSNGGFLSLFIINDHEDYIELFLAVDHALCDGASSSIIKLAISNIINSKEDESLSYREYCNAVKNNNTIETFYKNIDFFKSISELSVDTTKILSKLKHNPKKIEVKIDPSFDSLKNTFISMYQIGKRLCEYFNEDIVILRGLLNIREFKDYDFKNTIGDVHTSFIIPFKKDMQESDFEKLCYKEIDNFKKDLFRPGYLIYKYKKEIEKNFPNISKRYHDISRISFNYIGSVHPEELENFERDILDIQNQLNITSDGVYLTSFSCKDKLVIYFSRGDIFDK